MSCLKETCAELLLQINLRGFAARITETVSFSSPVSTADFCFPAGHWEHAASFHCAPGDDIKLKTKLPYQQASLSGQPADVACVTVTLSEPCASLTCSCVSSTHNRWFWGAQTYLSTMCAVNHSPSVTNNRFSVLFSSAFVLSTQLIRCAAFDPVQHRLHLILCHKLPLFHADQAR